MDAIRVFQKLMPDYSREIAYNAVTHPYLASATVIAPSCAKANTLATALMVMKPEEGLDFVDGNASIDA